MQSQTQIARKPIGKRKSKPSREIIIFKRIGLHDPLRPALVPHMISGPYDDSPEDQARLAADLADVNWKLQWSAKAKCVASVFEVPYVIRRPAA